MGLARGVSPGSQPVQGSLATEVIAILEAAQRIPTRALRACNVGFALTVAQRLQEKAQTDELLSSSLQVWAEHHFGFTLCLLNLRALRVRSALLIISSSKSSIPAGRSRRVAYSCEVGRKLGHLKPKECCLCRRQPAGRSSLAKAALWKSFWRSSRGIFVGRGQTGPVSPPPVPLWRHQKGQRLRTSSVGRIS